MKTNQELNQELDELQAEVGRLRALPAGPERRAAFERARDIARELNAEIVEKQKTIERAQALASVIA